MIERIVHLADIHIRKIPTRHEEYKQVFSNLYKSVKKQKPDRIVVVGDLVHNYLALETEQTILATSFLNELAKIAPVKITRGNHDFRKKNIKRVDSVAAIVKNMNNPNVEYYDKTGLYPDENVMWAVWHHGAKGNNPWKSKDGKKVLALKNESGYTNIDLFHDPINGCVSVTGFEMKKKSYYKIGDFKGDYSLLGDIHKQQFFHQDTMGYCSSLIAQDFGEGDDNFHGYLLWNIKEGNVEAVPVANEHSFKNVKLTPFTDFDDLDFEIEDPTKYMKVRIVWSTLPNTRNKENERQIISYIHEHYPNAIISHKNEFVEDDTIEIEEDVTIEDITSQEVQHEIFTKYLDKIGVPEDIVEEIIKLDDEITSTLEIEPITNIEWSIVKFGGENFMSYQKVDIDWRDKDGLYQITGINTAGKTTILKLISYILFSKTLETETRVKYGDKRFLNNKLDDDYCKGYLVLEANGEYYGIKKRTDVERKKNGDVKAAPTKVLYYALASPDDEMNDDNCIDALTEDDKNATQKKINEIVGSYENFMRVVMTTSDTLNHILSNDMADFIDSLLFDSGLDVFDKKLNGIKDHIKELNKKSRVTCNVEGIEKLNVDLEGNIAVLKEEISDIKDVKLPEVKSKITIGEKYGEDLTKKLFKIDPEIVDLDVVVTQKSISIHQTEIEQLVARKGILENFMKPLKETYDVERLTHLNERKEEHKQSVNDIKLENKEFERVKGEIEHSVEILKGKIHTAKLRGGEKKQEVADTKASKVCPTCGQELTAEHQVHIDEKIDKLVKEAFVLGDEIKEHQKVIDDVHNPKIKEHEVAIKKGGERVIELGVEMEEVLTEIGELTNDKNDVEKRNEYKTECDQVPIKTQNEELKKSILEKKIEDFNNSQTQILQNGKINKGIMAAKERLTILRDEETKHNETIVRKDGEVLQFQTTVDENKQLLIDFKDQERQDTIVNTYKKCVHRDGIPRQILSNNIIPKINVALENVLSIAPFKVWLDVDDLRPKLAYYNTPNAITDAISSSGKERTFASVVLKLALNDINVKSKPTIFLLDEVMGKLDNEGSVEEFVEILQVIKERCNKFLIIEHTHEVNPDHIIAVTRTDGGISSAFIE